MSRDLERPFVFQIPMWHEFCHRNFRIFIRQNGQQNENSQMDAKNIQNYFANCYQE